ncbi:hypothetical protein ACE1SV_70090 [Streptomyces sp. E-15]
MSTSRRSSGDSANISTGCMERGPRKPTIPATTRPKKGCAKVRAAKASWVSTAGSPAPETTSATVSARRVTSDRAARLGA